MSAAKPSKAKKSSTMPGKERRQGTRPNLDFSEVKLPREVPKWSPEKAAYPYPEKLKREVYERRKRELQIELLKVQSWVRETGQKIVQRNAHIDLIP